MKIKPIALLIITILLFHPASLVDVEQKREFKDKTFNKLKDMTMLYFNKYLYVDHDQTNKDLIIDFKGLNFDFEPEQKEEVTENTKQIESYTYVFLRKFKENDKYPIFSLNFHIEVGTDDLIVLLENKMVKAKKNIQYSLPLDASFVENSLKRTLYQYFDRLDQTINYFDVFVEDILDFSEIMKKGKDKGIVNSISEFDLKVLSINSPRISYKDKTQAQISEHFDIKNEILRLEQKDKKNQEMFAQNFELAKYLLKKPADQIDSNKSYDEGTAEYLLLSLTPKEEIMMKYGNVEVLCFYHGHRNLFTMIMKSSFFVFESDFNIMTRGFILENLEHNLVKVKMELYQTLDDLQNNNEAVNTLDEIFADTVTNLELVNNDEPNKDFDCFSSVTSGFVLCQIKKSDDNFVIRAYYAALNINHKEVEKKVEGSSDSFNTIVVRNKDEKSIHLMDTIVVRNKVIAHDSYYIEKSFPTNSMYDVSGFFKETINDMLLLGDAKNEELLIVGDQLIKIDLQEFKIKNYIESPQFLSPFSNNNVELNKILTISQLGEQGSQYYLNFENKETGLEAKWSSGIIGHTLLSAPEGLYVSSSKVIVKDETIEIGMNDKNKNNGQPENIIEIGMNDKNKNNNQPKVIGQPEYTIEIGMNDKNKKKTNEELDILRNNNKIQNIEIGFPAVNGNQDGQDNLENESRTNLNNNGQTQIIEITMQNKKKRVLRQYSNYLTNNLEEPSIFLELNEEKSLLDKARLLKKYLPII